MATLYERMGLAGLDFKAIIEHWYDLLLTDPRTKYAFEDRDVNHDNCKCNLGAFLVKAMGGPDNYKGKDVTKFHKEFPIGQEAFDALWVHLNDSLILHKAPEHCVNDLKALIYSLSSIIMNK